MDELVVGFARVEKLEEDLNSFKRRVILNEASVKENNILLFNLDETTEIKEVFKTDYFVYTRRLGKKQEGKNRPILVRCDTHGVKRQIINTCLQKNIQFADDLPLEIREARKSLIEEKKKFGKKAKILFPARLLVDGKIVKSVF